MLSFIELTGYVSDQYGYDDNAPSFQDQLWPLFLRNIDAIERVLLFKRISWDVNKRAFDAGEKVGPNIADIGPMEWLSHERLKEIQGYSFFGGHLNVLYQMLVTSSLLAPLFKLYPQPGKISNEEIDSLGIESSEISELRMLVQSIPNSGVLASFAHDADPLYIFGSLPTLKSLLNSIYNQDAGRLSNH